MDFTKPDRTLEEYSFTYLVRTTEPEIKGLTLDEPPKVPVASVTPYVRAELSRTRAPFRLGSDTSSPIAPATRLPAAADGPDDLLTDEETTAQITGFIDAAALKTLARDPATPQLQALYAASILTRHGDLQRYLGSVLAKAQGRQPLTGNRPVDWDDDPTIYQASTIAHGHILRFKQEWIGDGYSMGNLLYSLPLAPGQRKQIAIVDWERRETTSRSEFREARDSLEASIQRDRDITDIVTGTLTESMHGGSRSSSASPRGSGSQPSFPR